MSEDPPLTSAPSSPISTGMMPGVPLQVGCIGGGQLGRMMALEAPRLNIQLTFLDGSGPSCPAAMAVGASNVIQGGLYDADKIGELVQGKDVVTVEIEHINVPALAELEAKGVDVQPSSRVLGIIQDKFLQKQHFRDRGVPLPPFMSTSSVAEIKLACQQLGLPIMLKSRKGGYDGRGNAVLNEDDDASIEAALQELGIQDSNAHLDLYAEGWVKFDCEIAVMVVRSSSPELQPTRSYPAVNAIQQDSICRVVLAPARNVSAHVREMAEQLAVRAIDALGSGASGVFGVEMFVVGNQAVLLNEVAPRPHNTGHYTQDACYCSQFENHLRAICGLPLGSTDMKVEAAAMVNVLGAASGTMDDTLASSNAALMHMPRSSVHWYSKDGGSRLKGRKMGHINLVGHSHSEIDESLSKLLALEGIPVSILPGGKLESVPLVGVIMGSQSDLPTMHAAVDILKEFGVSYEVDIVSAHRTPDKLMKYSRSAADRGMRVIIAGAGGAAHLPGMVASMTPLPVIGVPVKTSTLSGVDSLYSIVQMPRGIPVATVAIGNAENAGLLAVRILSASRSDLRLQMANYQRQLRDAVQTTSAQLLAVGADDFLAQMDNKNKSVNV